MYWARTQGWSGSTGKVVRSCEESNAFALGTPHPTKETALTTISCSCVPGGFIVGEHRVEGAVLAAGGLLTTWSVKSLEDIEAETLAIVDILKPVPGSLAYGECRGFCVQWQIKGVRQGTSTGIILKIHLPLNISHRAAGARHGGPRGATARERGSAHPG